MTLEQLFERGRTRAIFFSGILVIVLCLYLVRYFVLPGIDPSLSLSSLSILAKILEDVSSTIIVTIFVAAFLWWITPTRVINTGLVIVEPRELKRHFSDALAKTNEWKFFGGCGRYFRSAVLSEMKARVRIDSTSKSVKAIILNPNNDTLCETHARYRSGTQRGKKEGNWTILRVKQELIATIIITRALSKTEPLIDVEIYVSDHFSSFRVDISQLCAIETKEDPIAPALRSDSGTYYFDALNDEFRLIKEQSRQINGGAAECAAVKDIHSIKIAISALGINASTLTDNDLSEIVTLIDKNSNPYG
jgi:hypothetical protein